MNKSNTKCRVCGKEYFCCSDSRKINSWRTMACSEECFQEYMKRINESRKSKDKQSVQKEPEKSTSTEKFPISNRKNVSKNKANKDNNVDVPIDICCEENNENL